MAVLSKHGATLATIERLTTKLAYMSDGKILINRGDGWKLYAKVKPGVDTAEHARSRVEAYKLFCAANPAYAEYRRVLHSMASFSKRGLVACAVEMLGNDVDGLWSELNDHADVGCDVSECQELAHAYDWCQRETKERRERKAIAAAGGKESSL